MNAKRFIFSQNGNFHTVIDTVENKPMGVFEFKENEFGAYACFHMIIDKMNELYKENLNLEVDRDYFKTKSSSLEEGYLQLQNKEYKLQKENEQLKQIVYDCESQIIGEWSSHIREDMKKLNKAYESEDINDLIRFCERS